MLDVFLERASDGLVTLWPALRSLARASHEVLLTESLIWGQMQWKGRVFYIDSDHFPDGDLLRRLTPSEPGLSAPPPGTVTQPR